MAQPPVAIDDMGQRRESLRSVTVVHHDGLPGIAPAGDMVDGPGKLQPQRTRHSNAVISLPWYLFVLLLGVNMVYIGSVPSLRICKYRS